MANKAPNRMIPLRPRRPSAPGDRRDRPHRRGGERPVAVDGVRVRDLGGGRRRQEILHGPQDGHGRREQRGTVNRLYRPVEAIRRGWIQSS